MSDWPIPAQQGVPSPDLVAAWETLGMLPTENVPVWAAHWIVAGHDGDALVYLAGLDGDDPHDVHDALPAALRDCGVTLPDSDTAAAMVAFTHVARMHMDGLASAHWVAQKVDDILCRTGYSRSAIELPLGQLYRVADEWDDYWGRTRDQLAAVIRDACEEQLRGSSAA